MIQLVVQEINTVSRRMFRSSGGNSEQDQCVYYSPEQLKHFGLVLVIDNREKWLQDDFCPLELQNPWLRGKLCVRIKEYSPLALKHSRATTVWCFRREREREKKKTLKTSCYVQISFDKCVLNLRNSCICTKLYTIFSFTVVLPSTTAATTCYQMLCSCYQKCYSENLFPWNVFSHIWDIFY